MTLLTKLYSRHAPGAPPAGGSAQTAVAAAGLAALAVPFAVLHRLGSGEGFSARVPEFTAAALAAGAVYCIALYALGRCAERRAARGLILAGAVVFRLMLLPLEPTLSQDIYRYRWDGHLAAAGWNPYTVAPADPRLAGLRAAHTRPFPGEEIPSVYPPLMQQVFRLAWQATAHLPERAAAVCFKLPFAAADLLVLAMLAAWLRRTGGKAAQLAVYAWNPLVIVEFAGSGHNDALALAALVAALLAIIRWREVVSTSLLAAAAMLKAFPVVLLPLWLRRAGWPRSAWGWVNAGAAAAVLAACAWPFRDAWPGILQTGAQFAGGWRHNNASLYSLVAWFSGSEELALGLGAGVVAGLALWAAARRMESARAAFLLLGAILLLSPNAFPWYFTWMAPLLVFLPHPAWLLLTVTQFLSYHVLIRYHALGVWEFETPMVWLTYAPFFALLAAKKFLSAEEHSGA